MSGFELNKILGAVLSAVLVLLAIGHIVEAIMHPHAPKERGFSVEVVENSGGAGQDKQDEGLPSILPLLASADIEAGKKVSKKCTACHTFEQGGPNKIGPNLWNTVNRKMASISGFGYSKAFLAMDASWGYEELNQYLYKPKKYIVGTKMNFVGLKKEKDRANMIAYLRSLSASPAPLPAAEVETPETSSENLAGAVEQNTSSENLAEAEAVQTDMENKETASKDEQNSQTDKLNTQLTITDTTTESSAQSDDLKK